MSKTYTLLIHECEEGGYAATCKELYEVNAQGQTMDELIEDAKAAIRFVEEVRSEEAQASNLKQVMVEL